MKQKIYRSLVRLLCFSLCINYKDFKPDSDNKATGGDIVIVILLILFSPAIAASMCLLHLQMHKALNDLHGFAAAPGFPFDGEAK